MTWENILKQTDEEPSEEKMLKERVDEFYEDMQDEIGYQITQLTNKMYEFENEMRDQKVFSSLRNEPKMKKFLDTFFDGVNLLREAQRIAEGKD